MFDVPNLDDMSTYAGDYDVAATVFADLSSYATTKARAMTYRAAGMIRNAEVWEKELEAIYKRLPEWAKW